MQRVYLNFIITHDSHIHVFPVPQLHRLCTEKNMHRLWRGWRSLCQHTAAAFETDAANAASAAAAFHAPTDDDKPGFSRGGSNANFLESDESQQSRQRQLCKMVGDLGNALSLRFWSGTGKRIRNLLLDSRSCRLRGRPVRDQAHGASAFQFSGRMCLPPGQFYALHTALVHLRSQATATKNVLT